jgi:hypothetical protein
MSVTNKLLRPWWRAKAWAGCQHALSRAAAGAARRSIRLDNSLSWEFSGFSQNGEDGIIDVLVSGLRDRTRQFVEIGASNGLQNNSSFRAVACRESGVMIDGGSRDVKRCGELLRMFTLGVDCRERFVSEDNVVDEMRSWPTRTPDLFSLDIDGQDYWVMQALLQAGFRPSVIVVEYNSAYGPERAETIPRNPAFSYLTASEHRLYYGVSLTAWNRLLAACGYLGICTDSNGVNAFFVLPERMTDDFMSALTPDLKFRENFWQLLRWPEGWSQQCLLLNELERVTV